LRATDAAWRTLADAALRGNRQWKNTGDLAWEARVGDKLAYKALQRLTSIGAVTRHPGGGFSVTDPERILAQLGAARTLQGARPTTLDAAQVLLAGASEYAIGGTRAAAHHLGGRNVIADHGPAIIYVPTSLNLGSLPHGDQALVFTADPHVLSTWSDGFTSPAQTYADLFAQSGWQASEFRRALWREWFTVDDWATSEATHA
jgi:hypothetical protein